MTTTNKSELKAKRIYLREQNKRFGPRLVEIHRQDWSAEALSHAKQPMRVWQSKDFAVHLWQDGAYQRLTVCRTAIKSDGSWQDGITWDELQRLKSEAGFGYCWAVECYPPDECLVNVANMRHLFLLHQPPAYGWHPLETPAILP